MDERQLSENPMIRKKACRQCLCLDPAVYALFLTAQHVLPSSLWSFIVLSIIF